MRWVKTDFLGVSGTRLSLDVSAPVGQIGEIGHDSAPLVRPVTQVGGRGVKVLQRLPRQSIKNHDSTLLCKCI